MQLIRSLWLLLLVTGFSQSQPYASSEASVLPQQDSIAALLQHSSDWVQRSKSYDDNHDDSDAATTSAQPQRVASLYSATNSAASIALATVRSANLARAPPVLSC
ncbi:hypothetical protein [Alkalimonas sp.]|uniref:hypothetical protein n=1 Tax=Alkalimonas sp. TaxID=1872453 RepID=UPI00263B117B|nr:hypothetical protein [Alkalimonas sp.]MCC5826020.1 hypothetical protein [Alkalimonas sp.]